MDTITHALLGAGVAHACQPGRQCQPSLSLSQRLSLGAVAAAFPDIDYVSYLIDPLRFISDWHRAETHSLVMLPLWALILAWIFSYLCKQKPLRRQAFLICCLALLSHILSDLITSWGTQVFAPFSDTRYAFGSSFVIDPYFTGIIFAGLLLGFIYKTVLPSRMALLLLLMYMGLQLVLKQQVMEIARQQVAANGWQARHIYTMPQPLSPFHWKLLVVTGDDYYQANLRMLKRDYLSWLPYSLASLSRQYRPVKDLHWQVYYRYGNGLLSAQIQSAWLQPAFIEFRRFARFPAHYASSANSDGQCHWFIDLRFSLPGIKPPFIYGMCRNLQQSPSWIVKPYH